jgi:hypothetical protein
MSLPVALAPKQARVFVASGDNAAFWTAFASLATLPTGVTAANIIAVSIVQNADGTIMLTLVNA